MHRPIHEMKLQRGVVRHVRYASKAMTLRHVLRRGCLRNGASQTRQARLLGATKGAARQTHFPLLAPLLCYSETLVTKLAVSKATMSASCLEQLRYLDQRLQENELTSEENDLVRQHRLNSLELRQKRIALLGPMPTEHTDTWGWEKQKQEAETEIKLALETMLLSTPGLEAAWQKHIEIEKLKKLRADILQNASALLAQQPTSGAATASPTTTQTPGWRDQATSAGVQWLPASLQLTM